MDCSMPGLPVLHHLPKFAHVHVHYISDAIQPSHLLMPSSPSALKPSRHQGLFPWVAVHIRRTKLLELQHQSFQWVLVSLRLMVLISLLSKVLSGVFSRTTVQRHQLLGILPSLQSSSQNHTWPLGKTIALTIRIFVSRVMSLLLNMLSRLVIAFLPRSKCLLTSWLQLPSAVILEPPKKKSSSLFPLFPIYLPWRDGTRCHGLSFLNVEL